MHLASLILKTGKWDSQLDPFFWFFAFAWGESDESIWLMTLHCHETDKRMWVLTLGPEQLHKLNFIYDIYSRKW